MAVDFKVPHQRTSEYLIEPKHLAVRPELNGRHDPPDIAKKLKSLVSLGQLAPILIGSDGGSPFIIDGHTRWRAAIEGIKTGLLPQEFRLRCVYFKGSAVEQFAACVAANHERDQSTSVDDAHNIAKFERFGMTVDQIADFYHEDTRWVKDRLALIFLSEESQQAVKSGKVARNAVQVLARLSKEQQAEAVKAEKVTAASVKAVAGKGKESKVSRLHVIKRAAIGYFPDDMLDGITERGAVQKFAEYLLTIK